MKPPAGRACPSHVVASRGLSVLLLLLGAVVFAACSGSGVVSMPPTTPAGIYVASEPPRGGSASDRAILVFSPDASGDVAPVRRIAGPQTGLASTNVQLAAVAVDRDGQVFVAVNATDVTSASVAVFPRMADGDVRPQRAFSAGPFVINGMAVGTDGRVYLTGTDNAVRVYAPGAAGFATPERVIRGSRTALDRPVGVAVDADGFIYVASLGNDALLIYAPAATGDVSPAHQILGPLTQLSSPAGLTLASSAIWVTNPFGTAPRITVYSLRHIPNTPPLAKIEGANTTLVLPYGIAVDRIPQVFVADTMRRAVLVYTGFGDVAPSRRIEGSNTRIGRPISLALYE